MSTFVIRLARSAQARLRGQVEHVRTGETVTFSSPTELLEFLRQMNAADPWPGTGDRKRPSDERPDRNTVRRQKGSAGASAAKRKG